MKQAAIKTATRLKEALLGTLAHERNRRDLTQAALGERAGLSRMSVQRAEEAGADLKLSTFIAMALALGLIPGLAPANPTEGASMVPPDLRTEWPRYVDRAWQVLRKNDNTIPSQVLDAMRDIWHMALAPEASVQVPRDAIADWSRFTQLAWLGLRKHDQSIPDHGIDAMKAILTAATAPSAPAALAHRGLAANRLKDPRNAAEKTLADAWAKVNQPSPHFPPVIEHLVPGCTQAQATAMATVIQWLGSEVGADFLARATGRLPGNR